VARHIEAVGGAARLRAVRSMRFTGLMTVKIQDRVLAGPFVREMKRPKKARMEMEVNATRMVQAFDGSSGWKLLPGQAAPEPMSAQELRDQDIQAEFDDLLFDYKSRGVIVEYLGEAVVGSTPALKLKVALRGHELHMYLDARSYLEVRRDHLGPGGEPLDESVIGGYRRTDGVMTPVSMEATARDQSVRTTLRFDKTELNVDIPDSRFGPP
jgi:outer membrane lipoprotein-sorting protein